MCDKNQHFQHSFFEKFITFSFLIFYLIYVLFDVKYPEIDVSAQKSYKKSSFQGLNQQNVFRSLETLWVLRG